MAAPITFSGIASGIDGDAIIKALIDAKKNQNAPLEAKVTNFKTENDALEEFNTKMLTLNDSLKDFLTLAGSSVSKTATSSNDDAVSVSAGSNAVATSTTINVQKLATSGSIAFADTFSDPSAPIAPSLSGPTTIKITVGTGDSAETIQVPVDSTTTIDQLAGSINAASTSGKVQASLINIGTASAPQYKLVVGSTRTGSDNGALNVEIPPELSSLGILQPGSITQAGDAVIQVNGLGTITRSNNQISDLIPGLTISLKQENTGPVTISVGNDADKTAKKLNDVITAYNEIVTYSSTNSKIDRIEDENGVTNKYGSLARTNVDNRAVDALRGAMAGLNSNVAGSAVQVFSDLGISTQKDGTLAFDTDKFMAAVASDPVAVDNLVHSFADKVGATNGIIADYTKFQGQLDQSISSNQEQIDTISDRLNRIQANLDKQTENLRLQFSKLESTIAKLNSDGQSLISLITGGSSSGS
jgi:flagellar hook-associated protein 2